jgi:hypothetical protein
MYKWKHLIVQIGEPLNPTKHDQDVGSYGPQTEQGEAFEFI